MISNSDMKKMLFIAEDSTVTVKCRTTIKSAVPLLEFVLKCNVGLSPVFICIHIISVLTNNTNLATYDKKKVT